MDNRQSSIRHKDFYTLKERHLYGVERLGINSTEVPIYENNAFTSFTHKEENIVHTDERGHKRYELTNHLGNVLAVINDRKIYNSTDQNYEPVMMSWSDYYAGGMLQPGRHSNSDSYRYLFNGMEHDGEVSGNGNSYTTEFRQYDPRLGRWKSLDPLMAKFPMMSPYVAFNNNPIFFTDPLGLEGGPAKTQYELPDIAWIPSEDEGHLPTKGMNVGDVIDIIQPSKNREEHVWKYSYRYKGNGEYHRSSYVRGAETTGGQIIKANGGTLQDFSNYINVPPSAIGGGENPVAIREAVVQIATEELATSGGPKLAAPTANSPTPQNVQSLGTSTTTKKPQSGTNDAEEITKRIFDYASQASGILIDRRIETIKIEQASLKQQLAIAKKKAQKEAIRAALKANAQEMKLLKNVLKKGAEKLIAPIAAGVSVVDAISDPTPGKITKAVGDVVMLGLGPLCPPCALTYFGVSILGSVMGWW